MKTRKRAKKEHTGISAGDAATASEKVVIAIVSERTPPISIAVLTSWTAPHTRRHVAVDNELFIQQFIICIRLLYRKTANPTLKNSKNQML